MTKNDAKMILSVLYIEHRMCYNILYERQHERREELL